MTSMVASALAADASAVIEPIGGDEKILNCARLMEEEIAKRLSTLTSQLVRLRATTVEGEG